MGARLSFLTGGPVPERYRARIEVVAISECVGIVNKEQTIFVGLGEVFGYVAANEASGSSDDNHGLKINQLAASGKRVYSENTVVFFKSYRWVAVLGLFLLASSCAVAPLSNHVSARTNGEGNSLLSAGSTIGVKNSGWVPSVRYSLGITDRFDLGFQYEVVEYGVSGKYLLVGGGEGFSLAGLGGLGTSFGGFYGFLGPVVSYKWGIFEPYFVERYNYVRYPERNANVEAVGEIHVNPGTYHYLQHTLGFFLWPLDWFGFGLETSAFATLDSPFILDGQDRFLLSGQMSFRF